MQCHLAAERHGKRCNHSIACARHVKHFACLGRDVDALIFREQCHAFFRASQQQRIDRQPLTQLAYFLFQFLLARPAPHHIAQLAAIGRQEAGLRVALVVIALRINQHRKARRPGGFDHALDVGQTAFAIVTHDDDVVILQQCFELFEFVAQHLVARLCLEIDADQLLLASDDAQLDGGGQVQGDAAKRFLGGRALPGTVNAAQALDAARREHLILLAHPRNASLSAPWTAVGPNQIDSATFGNLSGRVTAIAIDPADATGNTIYVGTTGGGVWKSANAAEASPIFVPLTDTLSVFNSTTQVTPSLSIGSLAIANGVLLAGTGDPNDATDSYYGAGILRSLDGGVTWTLAQQSSDSVTGNRAFFGLSVAGLAFSSANPSLAVAALSQAAEGEIVNAPNTSASEMGLYYSNDGGVTWHLSTIMDGSQTVQTGLAVGNNGGGVAATSVVWNPIRHSFFAAIRYHGYYGSPDGMTWTRLAQQPGAGLTASACPTTYASSSCLIFRGALAVQPASGDMFALTVDGSNLAQGLYRDICSLSGTNCGNAAVTFGTVLNAASLEVGSGSTQIPQGDYNLTLAAVASGTDTILYAGTIDLYRCSIAAGCVLRNTTNAQNGCTNSAMVAPAQHAIATLATAGNPLLYLGNDGGLWRSSDGANETGQPCSLTDAAHFQNLNGGLGSLAEVVSFAQDPASASTLLAGLGALGTAGTGTVTNSWPQLSMGEGGTVAIDSTNPTAWYLSTGAGVNVARCANGAGCTAANFTATAIGATQISNDAAAIHAPWLLDPALTSNLIAGTCRVWRGPATGGGLWSSANDISAPFATPSAVSCGSDPPVVRSLAGGGPVSASGNAQNAGSKAIYAGMAGSLDGGLTLGGHLFSSVAANLATNTTAWSDLAKSSVVNDVADAGVFNPGGFDVSSVAVDSHDASGATVYATVMGFTGNGVNAPHVYRTVDAGAHWANISSNLPNAPANSLAVDPNDANTVYVALDTGVYVTTAVTICATANCWSVYGTALPNSPVVQLAAAAAMPTGDGRLGELRAATYGRGIWQIPLLTAIAPAAPAMTINPLVFAFTAQQVGTASPYVTFTVTNIGNADLVVGSVAATGDFNETDTCAGATVAQNATCTVQVRFLPTVAGTRTGVLTVYGNVAGGQVTASLSGVGTPPAAVVLTPITLAFPATNVGASSSAQSLTVSNTGGTNTTLQTPAITGDFTIAANTCGPSLGPGVGCTLAIVFAPTATGTRSGTLTVVDGAGTQVASISGMGVNPATDSLSPLTLSFAAQQLSTTSASQQIMLSNAGDVALTLVSAQIASGDFSVVNGCGNSLNAKSSCSLLVTYSPKSVGVETGTLVVSDEYRSQSVALSGTGLAPPGVSLSPLSGLNFGAVGVGLVAASQLVTLTNNGGVPLALAGITASGDFGLLPGGNSCGATLAPAGVCSVQIVFSPTAAGARTGTVTFTDNATNSPQTLVLSGTGVDFALASNGPASITISSGQSATYALLLTSIAGLPGTATFTCAGVPAHSTCTVNPASAALGGVTNVSVTVATGLSTVRLDAPEIAVDAAGDLVGNPAAVRFAGTPAHARGCHPASAWGGWLRHDSDRSVGCEFRRHGGCDAWRNLYPGRRGVERRSGAFGGFDADRAVMGQAGAAASQATWPALKPDAQAH